MMFLRFTHVFLFIAVLFHGRNVLFLYSVDGHLVCFYLYDIMSSAALIILVHTFGTYVCISTYVDMELLGSALADTANSFQSGCTSSHSKQ